MRLIDADKLFENFRTTFPASEAFQILFQAPTVCDIEQIRAEIASHIGGCGYLNDGLDLALRIIDKHTEGR